MTSSVRDRTAVPSGSRLLPAVRRFVSSRTGLVALFVVGLVLRLLIAPHVGFWGDMRDYAAWAQRLGQFGPHYFYAPGYFADYPPAYLYVLWLLGKISSVFGNGTPSYLLLKIPAFACDLGLAWVSGTFATRLRPDVPERRVRTIAAVAILFNPALPVTLSFEEWILFNSIVPVLLIYVLFALYMRNAPEA